MRHIQHLHRMVGESEVMTQTVRAGAAGLLEPQQFPSQHSIPGSLASAVLPTAAQAATDCIQCAR